MRVLADRAATGGQLALIEQRAPHGFSPPEHVHQNEDHLLSVVEGEVTAQLGDEQRVARAGEVVWMPRGIVHSFRVDSDQALLLEITTPAGFEQFHIDLGEPATELRLPDPGPLDVAALAGGSARFDCDIVGPPMAPAGRG